MAKQHRKTRHFTHDEKVQLTMSLCDKCGNNLTTHEHVLGTTCGHCIMVANGTAPIRIVKDELQGEKVAALLKQWERDNSGIVLLPEFEVNFIGELYLVSVVADSALMPCAVVREKKGKTIYANGDGTSTGKDVYNYCKSEANNLINQNVK